MGKIPETKTSGFRLYTLRHSRATHMMDSMIEKKGVVDLHAIANFLGHKDIRSTQVYLHATKKYKSYMRDIVEL